MEGTSDQTDLTGRSAGILLHITSLPGPAYIGDLGPAAAAFAEFLHRCHQTVWQMLPVQPTGPDQGYSPYSASSAFAGQPLLISLDLLVKDGWLQKKELRRGDPADTKVDYSKAFSYKEKLLVKAWESWKANSSDAEKVSFTEFCAREKAWLDDYAMYAHLKSVHKNAAWYQWPAEFKHREQRALARISAEAQDELDRIKWTQMIFDRQWTALHKLCDSLQIRLLGDVPIYVAHDSADVWSNPELFTVDRDGNLTDVAGVPPDLFNDEGQLWGMPLYNWDVVRDRNYDWWVKRFHKNLEWFDIVRLDHFRGFSSYWSVPATEKTAKNGSWVPGPGSEFFTKMKEELGRLPFVAEDLGEIDKPVYILRDEFELPGMNVLQFAFGDDMPKSSYLPHHYISNSLVYTGTHDNNTSLGWYKSAGATEKKNLAGYVGGRVNAGNVVDHLIRMAYMSVSRLAILPMQDVLSLDKSARMNMPASTSGNWSWRMRKDAMSADVEEKLAQLCFYYNRLR